MAQYSLFVLKALLNPKQTNKHVAIWRLSTKVVFPKKNLMGLFQWGYE